MRFNPNSQYAGKHAFLSASKGSWVNYTDEKLDRVFRVANAAQHGTDLHKLANDLIRMRVRLPEEPVTTMGLYVNDAIGYRLSPEVILFYSPNCFGTADAVGFKAATSVRRSKLRIFDLKTGVIETGERQLEIYAGLFCLEYGFKPHDIDTELRVYQNNDIRAYEADPDVIAHIMDRIVVFDRRINELREELD